jgi:hypothetical protein
MRRILSGFALVCLACEGEGSVAAPSSGALKTSQCDQYQAQLEGIDLACNSDADCQLVTDGWASPANNVACCQVSLPKTSAANYTSIREQWLTSCLPPGATMSCNDCIPVARCVGGSCTVDLGGL